MEVQLFSDDISLWLAPVPMHIMSNLMSMLHCQWNLTKLSVEDHSGPVLGMVWHGGKEHGLWNKVDLCSDLFSAIIICDPG